MNNNYHDHQHISSECLWNLKDVTRVLIFYFFMSYAGIPAIYHFINYVTGKDLTAVFGENVLIVIFSIFVGLVSSLYIIYIVCVEYKLPLTSLGLTLYNWKQDILEGLKKYIIAIPVFILAGLVTDFICKLTDWAPQQQEIAKRVLGESSTNALILIIFFGCFAAPVVEELIFRGFLQTALNRRFGRWKAILYSSFFFRLCT